MMRTNAVGGQFAVTPESLTFQAVYAKYAATGVAGVILRAVQPLTLAVEHSMAIEVTVGRGVECLQQAAVAQIVA